jgi:hypothetical protein
MSKCGPACEMYNLAQGTHGEHIAFCDLYPAWVQQREQVARLRTDGIAREITYAEAEIALRDQIRIAEAVRDDARRECQRLLEEKRALAIALGEACKIAHRLADSTEWLTADFERLANLEKLGEP